MEQVKEHKTTQLDPADWISAGFRALAKGGPAAIRIEPIARDLGTSKGSYYWHFKNVAALKTAMLNFWKNAATNAITAGRDQIPPGAGRLSALLNSASSAARDQAGHISEPAIRDWARYDTEAAVAVAHVDTCRIRFLEEEMAETGPDALTRARLFYAAHLGLEIMEGIGGTSGEAERDILINRLS